MKLPTTKIFLNLQRGLDKGGLDNVEYGISLFFAIFIKKLLNLQI